MCGLITIQEQLLKQAEVDKLFLLLKKNYNSLEAEDDDSLPWTASLTPYDPNLSLIWPKEFLNLVIELSAINYIPRDKSDDIWDIKSL